MMMEFYYFLAYSTLLIITMVLAPVALWLYIANALAARRERLYKQTKRNKRQ